MIAYISKRERAPWKLFYTRKTSSYSSANGYSTSIFYDSISRQKFIKTPSETPQIVGETVYLVEGSLY